MIDTTPFLTAWLKTIQPSIHGADDEETGYEKSKEWWEPYVYYAEGYEGDDDSKEVDWLCDHLGDARGVMEHLWNEILRLRSLLGEKP